MVVKNIPELRFGEFSDVWKEEYLGLLGDLKNGFNADKEAFGSGVEFINLMDIFGQSEISRMPLGRVQISQSQLEQYKIKRGDVLFVRSSVKREGVGQSCLVNDDFVDTIYSGFIIRFRQKEKILDYSFQKYCFATSIFRKKILSVATSSANTNINQESLVGIKLSYPKENEQQKIAAFLTSVDDKVNKLRCKRELLLTHKRGLIQKIFSQELRFTQDDGTAFPDWEDKTLRDLADRQIVKNTSDNINRVLTNSATRGVLDQRDYFDKDIANASNLKGYYIVEKGDYVYNPRISVHAPVGPISKNKLGQGLMSPLYSIFRFKDKNNEFYEQYFQTRLWHHYMCSVANYGARHDRMNITTSDFMDMPLPFPHPDEQKKIVEFLHVFDKKIDAEMNRLAGLETFKKGLLQKMFV